MMRDPLPAVLIRRGRMQLLPNRSERGTVAKEIPTTDENL
jgi:hypothetical protein